MDFNLLEVLRHGNLSHVAPLEQFFLVDPAEQ